jgi:hypothetical protein
MTPPSISAGNLGDGVLAEQAIQAEIDTGFTGGDRVLGGQRLGVAGRRNGVRHVEHRGDAAEGRGRGSARPVLLVRIARVAEMHVHVDGAGQNVQAARIEGLARERHRLVGADRDDAAVLDRDAGCDHAVMRHHRAVADDEVGGGAAIAGQLTASPSRRRPEDRRR